MQPTVRGTLGESAPLIPTASKVMALANKTPGSYEKSLLATRAVNITAMQLRREGYK